MVKQAYQSQESRKRQPTYVSRDPAAGRVFSVVQRSWRKFEQEARRVDKAPAPYVAREFEKFLGCGVLARGFIRLKCDSCSENRLVAFSCKRRGFCPSCCGRRMNDGAAFFVDHVFPQVPVRQWVVSYPIPVRFWMARNPRLITQSLEIFHRALRAHYVRAAKKLGATGQIQTGAVTVIQRFGGALNLNVHLHALVLDGVYVVSGDSPPVFIETPRPTQDEVMALIQTLQSRMLRALQRRGLVQKLEAESGGEAADLEETIEAVCQGASVQYRMATGGQPGRPVRRIGSLGAIGEDPAPTGELSAIIGGYSIHANTYVHKNNRAELERLCRYVLRPPVAEERLELKGDTVVYKLKSPWRDGTRAIMFSGTEFIEKLVAIIPQPRIHQTRFHGVLAPHAEVRKLIVPAPAAVPPRAAGVGATAESVKNAKPQRLRWAELLSRVFGIDLKHCPCGGNLTVIAAITDPDITRKILEHMGLPATIPRFAPP